MADPTHPDEPHTNGVGARLNALRAGVLGANDGIVSTAGIVIGVAAATASRAAIATAGLAGLAAGAMSMAVGEYVSVSTQRDTEQAMVAKEVRELREEPEAELDELTAMYAAKGLDASLAREVAVQLTAHDALGAHAAVELGIDPENFTSPMHAALASLVSFTIGALLPILAILLSSQPARIWVTVVAVLAALALTGFSSARLGRSPVGRPVVRNLIGGVLAMGITYLVGRIVGTQV